MNTTVVSIIQRIISDSNIHVGIRVFIAMAMTFVIPLPIFTSALFSQPPSHLSISLCLGVMAYAIVENDDNHIGRQKFLFAILGCFFIASSSVELLMPYPILFGLGLLSSTFIFMMIGILGSRYSKVGFGAILVAIYTMVGHQSSTNWYEQPIMLTVGACWYGIFSIVWNFFTPNRSLREQLAQLFFTLSRYQKQKSSLFNEVEVYNHESLYNVRQQLAIHNIDIMARMTLSKNTIKSRMKVRKKQNELCQLNRLYIIAEQIHERVIASQYLYSQLENNFGTSQILEGYHLLLIELSENFYQLGTSITDKNFYQHSRRLKWVVKALSDQLTLLKQEFLSVKEDNEALLALQAIYDNIKGIDELLKTVSTKSDLNPIIIDTEKETAKPSIWEKVVSAFSPHNSTFKHAVRISTSLLLAFIIQQYFQLEHGFWLLLTVLFVCQPSYSETRKRLIQRVLGTLVGLIIGFPIILVVSDPALQIFLMISSAFFFFSYLRTNYAFAIVFITLFVMFVFNILTGEGMGVLPARILETIMGGILSVLAISFIFPDWQFQRFPSLANGLLTYSNRYFKLICSQYEFGRSENLNYRITRFSTFQAEAKLTSAWQSMLFEPSSKQKLNSEVYTLVNRCDALVSYISALASHRHKIDCFADDIELQTLIDNTAEQLSLANGPKESSKAKKDEITKAFESYKMKATGEVLLIVEQLRLIALTSLDIQVLLHKINLTQKNPN